MRSEAPVSSRRKAVGRRPKAESGRLLAAFCLLPTAYCLLLLASCSRQPPATPQGKRLKFVMVTHDAGTAFFVPHRQALEDFAARYGVEADFLGPKTFDVAAQVKILESLVESGVDGIATTTPDPQAYEPVISLALNRGIPVVVYNTDSSNPQRRRMAFVGQDDRKAGAALGREIIRLMGGRGKVAIVICCPGHPAIETRARGVLETLAASGIQAVGPLSVGADQSKAFGAVEAILQGDPSLDGIFGCDAYTEVIGRYLETRQLPKKLKAGGWDLLPNTLQAIQRGYLQVSIGQNPYLQGYYSILQLYLYKTRGIQPMDIDTGVEIVTAQNVDRYISKP